MSTFDLWSKINFLTTSQWPDDYDFDETRAINSPAATKTDSRSEDVETEEKRDIKTEEKRDIQASVASVSDQTELENDLDPVGLKKAFRFAVWSSVIMVGSIQQ